VIAAMTPLAMQMIHTALAPLIKSGRRVENFKLYVSSLSRFAEVESIHTKFGLLKIQPSNYVPKGCSYVLEEPKKGRAFAWVSKHKPTIQEGKKHE